MGDLRAGLTFLLSKDHKKGNFCIIKADVIPLRSYEGQSVEITRMIANEEKLIINRTTHIWNFVSERINDANIANVN